MLCTIHVSVLDSQAAKSSPPSFTPRGPSPFLAAFWTRNKTLTYITDPTFNVCSSGSIHKHGRYVYKNNVPICCKIAIGVYIVDGCLCTTAVQFMYLQ